MNRPPNHGAAAPGNAAACPAFPDPRRGEAGGGAAGFKARNASTDHADHSAEAGAECKTFASLAARAALAGSMLHRLAAGGYVLTGRNGWGRELPDLRAVGELLSRIDGRRST